MAAYTSHSWSELFVASAGASAALTGLLFVAVSINVERILFGSGIALLMRKSLPASREHTWTSSRLLETVPGTLPFVIGPVSLRSESGGGLYWTVGGIVGALVGAVISAWVLLVEILR